MTTADEELAGVRVALLEQANSYARRVLAAADAAAIEVTKQADTAARRLGETARREGEAEAASLVAGQHARRRRQVRAQLLQAQRDAYDDLLHTARAQARQLVAEQPAVHARLGKLACQELGPEAEVTTRDDGTVVGELAARRWSWSPDGFADETVRSLGPDLERLWSP